MNSIARTVALSLTLATLSFTGCARQLKHQLKIDGLPADLANITSYTVNITNASGTVEVLTKPNLKAPWVDMKRSRPRAGADMAGPGKHPEQYSNATFSDSNGQGTLTVVSTAGDIATAGEWVRIVVWVPSLDNVKIRNSGGHVLIKNARGAVDVQNATTSLGVGSIACSSTFPVKSSFSLSTNEGNIDVSMLPTSDLKLDAVASGGQVTISARSTSIGQALERGSEWSGVINSGTATGAIRTGKGNIKLRVGGPD